MESAIYSKYKSVGGEALARFKSFAMLDTIANSDITKYDEILKVDYSTILLHTDLQLQKIQLQEQKAEQERLNNKNRR